MLLMIGQGNPGEKYAGNRHNVGFMVVDAIAATHNFGPWRAKFSSEACEGRLETADGPAKVLLLKPQTFYNETGRAAAEAARFFKIPVGDVVVFHDEIDLAPGKFRLKTGGGAAGNNGVKSITAALGPNFRRGRIGVGHPGHKDRVMPHVLSDFSKAERDWLTPLLDAIARSIPLLISDKDNAFQTQVAHLAPAPKHVRPDAAANEAEKLQR